MAKDFARRKNSYDRTFASRQYLVALIFFLTGYLCASFFDVTNLSRWISSQIAEQRRSQTPKPTLTQALPKPKLEFYTLLASANTDPVVEPSKTVPTAVSKVPEVVQASKAHSEPLKISPTAAAPYVSAKQEDIPKGVFLVQVAAFKTRQEAEKMKASLSLKGFSVTLTVDNPQKINWHRVCLGPYATRSQAEKAQMAVSKSEHIVGMIRKMQG